MDLKISKMTWVHERNKFKICFFFMKKWHSSRKIAYCENFWTCFKMALLRGWHFSGWHKARPYCTYTNRPLLAYPQRGRMFFISGAYLTILIIKTISFKEVFLGDSEKKRKKKSSYLSNDHHFSRK